MTTTAQTVEVIDRVAAQFQAGHDIPFRPIMSVWESLSDAERACFDDMPDFWAAVLARVFPEALGL